MIEIEMVKIPGVTFKIGKYPVTQEQYEAVMGINPSYFINRPQNPVESVSYNDAIAFYQKLRKKTGKNFAYLQIQNGNMPVGQELKPYLALVMIPSI
jgi:formylglycine-generating enzyme required for sulfatase activity